jgi:O-methyltransferase
MAKVLLRTMLTAPLFSPLRLLAWRVLSTALAARDMAIVPAGRDPRRKPTYAFIRKVRSETQMLLIDPEAYSIHSLASQSMKIPGVIAEVGVFRGGSARLICDVKGDRPLHLFDTFAGLPDAGKHDDRFQRGSFTSDIEDVRAYLKPFPNVFFHQGYFPDSAQGLEELRFSFVHIDVDLYESTKGCLEWFYDKMNSGAVLISHDYSVAEGVRKAFDDFFADKPECLIELEGTQVAFTKL